jgi:SAM-dependent methyltransferase
MPRTRAVDRIDYLTGLARGRRVVHVGFAGESRANIDQLVHRPTWLHGRLARVAGHLAGVDVDPEAVARACAAGFDAHAADATDGAALAALSMRPADVVIAAEIIEHVETPGRFLEAMHEILAPGGSLVVTTPNAASMLNPLAAMGRFELINPDHVAFYSWFTLTNLMARHGWAVNEVVTYGFPFAAEAWTGSAVATAGRALARAQAGLSRIWPYVNFGLIVVAREDPHHRASSVAADPPS